jgi:hypothetical protein
MDHFASRPYFRAIGALAYILLDPDNFRLPVRGDVRPPSAPGTQGRLRNGTGPTHIPCHRGTRRSNAAEGHITHLTVKHGDEARTYFDEQTQPLFALLRCLLRRLTLGDLAGHRGLSLTRFIDRQACLEFRNTMQQFSSGRFRVHRDEVSDSSSDSVVQ